MVSSRRTIVKRVTVCLAAIVLTFVGYLASAPMVVGLVLPRFPASFPVLLFVYRPLDYYARHPECPGSDSYRTYAEWCRERLEPPPPVMQIPPQRALPNNGIPAP